MVLFASLNTALSGLQAQMTALQTTGHNIANATTPGFSRQRVEYETLRPNDLSYAQIGSGVRVKRIRRIIDDALESRIRDSSSDLGGAKIKSETMNRMESVFNALSGSDIGTMLDNFFKSIEDLANKPEDTSTRSVAISQAQILADSLKSTAGSIRDVRESLNDEVVVDVGEINRITDEIANLNGQILGSEDGGINIGAANDLRDRRDSLVKQLSEYVDLRAIETSRGEVNVLVGSSFIVFGSQSYELTTTDSVDNGSVISTPVFANGGGVFETTGGTLGGVLASRDELLTDILQKLNTFANSIIYEFNKVNSSGQGLERFGDLTSVNGVRTSTFPLAIAGEATATSASKDTIIDSSLIGFPNPVGEDVFILSGDNILERRRISSFDSSTGTIVLDEDLANPIAAGDKFQISPFSFELKNGSFDVVLTNELTGVQTSYNIAVDLDKLPPNAGLDDTTLQDIVNQINGVAPGTITASITSEGKLRIQSSSSDIKFNFAGDTSGFLAAIGMNTFFTGDRAENISVNALIARNPNLLAAARSNARGDNSNALAMSELRGATPVLGQYSFDDFYQGLIGDVSSKTAEYGSRLDNADLIQQQLLNQRERISGVNIDEEAVNMITYQRAYQASARFISIVDQMLDTLINGM